MKENIQKPAAIEITPLQKRELVKLLRLEELLARLGVFESGRPEEFKVKIDLYETVVFRDSAFRINDQPLTTAEVAEKLKTVGADVWHVVRYFDSYADFKGNKTAEKTAKAIKNRVFDPITSREISELDVSLKKQRDRIAKLTVNEGIKNDFVFLDDIKQTAQRVEYLKEQGAEINPEREMELKKRYLDPRKELNLQTASSEEYGPSDRVDALLFAAEAAEQLGEDTSFVNDFFSLSKLVEVRNSLKQRRFFKSKEVEREIREWDKRIALFAKYSGEKQKAEKPKQKRFREVFSAPKTIFSRML